MTVLDVFIVAMLLLGVGSTLSLLGVSSACSRMEEQRLTREEPYA